MPTHLAGEIGSPRTKAAAKITPTNCAAVNAWARLSGTERRTNAYRSPAQPNSVRPATDFQLSTPSTIRSVDGAEAPTLSIRFAAMVRNTIVAKPSQVCGLTIKGFSDRDRPRPDRRPGHLVHPS